jgi:hypothetical protein
MRRPFQAGGHVPVTSDVPPLVAMNRCHFWIPDEAVAIIWGGWIGNLAPCVRAPVTSARDFRQSIRAEPIDARRQMLSTW